jgi:hypothetical protein
MIFLIVVPAPRAFAIAQPVAAHLVPINIGTGWPIW